MKKSQEKSETKLSLYQLRKLIREEYGRGIPDFATTDAAEKSADHMKGYILMFIQQRNLNSTENRQMVAKANDALKGMKSEIKQVIEKHLLEFLYRV